MCCTSGDQGGEDPKLILLALSALREAEQRAATAAVIGYAGGLSSCTNPTARCVTTWRSASCSSCVPDLPSGRGPGHRPGGPLLPHGGVNHTDHRAAGFVVVYAVYPAARSPMAFPWLAKACKGIAASGACTCSGLNQPTVPAIYVGDDRPQAVGAGRRTRADP